MRIIRILISVLLIVIVGYCLTQQPQLVWNNECLKLVLLRGGYRSWSIYYSYGLEIRPDGSTRNLWHFPTFAHVDVRKLKLKQL